MYALRVTLTLALFGGFSSVNGQPSNALENLAARTLGVHVESDLLIEGIGGRERPMLEVTRQEIDGVMSNARIVAMGSAPASDVTPFAPGRQVFAPGIHRRIQCCQCLCSG